ncbi:MAG: 3-isopropylmalate dehydratase large subunit [Candidatus Kariarchaeaceae archaeon]|jgi:3-isopropylmalate/(R)-2-methylmalate dehydratase large subunit
MVTITEQILSEHCGKQVEPGDFINANLDLVLANDITAPIAINEMQKHGIEKVFDPTKIVLVPDHMTPNKDIKAATLCKTMREFANKHDLIYYEVGRGGIEHALLPQEGLVRPGMLIIGADSHTCTYGALGAFSTGVGSTDVAAAMATGELWFKVPESMKFVFTGKLGTAVMGKDMILYLIGQIGVDGAIYRSMEFTGDSIHALSIDGRLSLCNMAIEAGGKNGIIEADDKTIQYVKERTSQDYKIFKSDKDSNYFKIIEFDATDIEPQVALPHSPANATPVSEVPDINIQQAVIGSCTNGKMEDLRVAARILKGNKVSMDVRCIIIPATQKMYLQALNEGLIDIFIKSGCVVSTPTCGPCLGMHMGVLAKGEKAIATTNRNFVGRMGDPGSGVYLSNPATAAASAIEGIITDPRGYLK